MDYENIPGSDRHGATEGDHTQMVPEIAAAAAAAARTGGVPLIADANGVVVLPAGATLDDIKVVGRDLVITLDNGQVFVIPEGAVYVPQIVIDGVAVPPLNLAALLIGEAPVQPAAGPPNSSGNNFFEDAGPIQKAHPIGDLLPPTEFGFLADQREEVIPQPVDRDPTIGIITVNQPVAVIDATASVAESGLPARNGGEPAGSNAAANTETTSGTIVFSSPDGIASLTINGTLFTAPGQTFVSPRGTLTITTFDPVTGTAKFTYTLTDNVVGGTLADQFTVALTDPDGDVATSTLTINVADDAPTARPDTDTVPAGSFAAQTGNVITGVGTTSGVAGADTLGADNASITRIASNALAANTDTSFDAAGNLQVSGQYGVLTIKADGSYSFTRNPGTPGGVSDAFTYTLTDADGSSSTATLTIAIADAVPVITSVPPAGSAATIVAESGLPARTGEAPGSNAPAPTETTSGTVTFAGGDGPVSATINGVAVAVGAVVTTPSGTLTVTSFDPVSGAIGYTFTLADNTLGDTTSVAFNVVVTDVDGDTAPGAFTITVTDDVPLAVNDSATQATENAAVTVNVLANDIQGADSVAFSAVAAVPGTLSGTGTLVYNANGTFTYTPGAGEQGNVTFDYTITDGDGDTSRATVTIALLADSTPTVSVAGDNTVSEAALPARGEEPAGSNAASPDETATGTIGVATGGDTLASLVINGVNVTNGGTVTTAKGVLTVSVANGAYGYSYTLADNTLADPSSDSFAIVVTDSDGDTASTSLVIAIADDTPTARDDAGSVAAGTYGPISGSVTANDTPGADGIVVQSYARGEITALAGATLQGQYGTLTIAANGSYSYTRNAGTPGGVSDSFAYTVRDGDGDTSTANLVIAIANSGTTLTIPPSGTPGSTQVLEAGLPAGSAAATNGEFASGSFAFTAPDGPATVTIGGIAVTAVGQTITGSFGTLTITSIASGSIGYAYQLTTNTNGDTTSESFAVTVTDKDGDASSGSLTIAIVDDVPTARADIDSVREDGPTIATGNVVTGVDRVEGDANTTDGIADTRGADGASISAVSFGNIAGTVGGSTTGTYGTLTLNADGSYSYALNNANPLVQGLDKTQTLTETFTYTLRDGDGDTSPATLTITITGADDGVTITGLDAEGGEATVFEANLAAGSAPNAGALTKTGSFSTAGIDGIATIVVGGKTVYSGGAFVPGQTISNDHGTLTITGVTPVKDAVGDTVSATVTYSYTLNANTVAHTGANGAQLTDSFAVTVTDTDGSAATKSLDVVVVDDVPTARADADSVSEDGALVADGNVISGSGGADANATDGAADTRGADGASVSALSFGATPGTVGSALAGTYGNLTLAADGSYAYVLNNANPLVQGLDKTQTLTETFAYTLRDGDGDTSPSTLTITIQGSDDGVTLTGLNTEGGEKTVFEANLAAGSSPNAAALTQTGTFSTAGVDGIASIVVGTKTVYTGGAFVAGQSIVTAQGTLTITGVTPVKDASGDTTSATVAYSYTLNSNTLAHGAAGNDAIFDSFAVTVTDTDGSTASDSLDVKIVDDVPTARADADSVTEDGPLVADGNVITGSGGTDVNATDGVLDTRGADGAVVAAVAFVPVAGETTAGTVGSALAGAYGTLTLGANGGYSYALNNASAAVQNLDDGEALTETFSYTLTDGDGDTSPATLTITINGTNDAPVVGTGSATVSEEGLAGANADAVGATDTTDSAVATGTISITDADVEPSTVTLGDPGAVLTSGGATVTWSGIGTGTLTGSVGDTPVIRIAISNTGSYTVTLLGPVDQATANVEDVKTFTVPVSVSDGTATVPTTLTVTIEDDSPLAANDTDAVTEDGPTTATGNVLTGVGSDGNAAGADSIGADGAAAGGAVVALAGGTVGTPLAGTYGSLTLGATGGYTYTLNNALPAIQGLDDSDAPLTETFTYTISDRDGDTATATLTVTINGTNDAPVVGTGTATVSEEGLKGANADAVGTTDTTDSTTFSGTISITDADVEPSTVTLGDPGSVLTSGGAMVTWSGIGTGTLTGSANGGDVVRVTIDNTGNYTVTLLGPVDQATANVEDTKTFVVPVSVSDGTATVPTTLTVTIEDDSPLAANDTDAVTEDGPTSATGNVLTGVGADGNAAGADSIGADGPAAGGAVTAIAGGTVGSALAGTYGSLTLNANGSYTYTLNNADPRVQGLDGDDKLTETFTYTISDRDGDTATATLTVTINGANDPVTITGLNTEGGEKTVFEANLSDGSAPNAGALTQTGSFSVAGIDGIATIKVGGLTVFAGGTVTTGQTFNAAFGTLAITSVSPVKDAAGDTVSATIGYSYTLNDNTLTHPAAGNDSIFDSFTVTVTDSDGSTATDSLDVVVVDDAPTARADADSVSEDGALVADGNVITGSGGTDANATDGVADTRGADGASVSALSFGATPGTVGSALAGTYGSLTLAADGSYAYVLNNANPLVQGLDKAQTLTETFAYTLRDGDGDTSPSTLTITIQGSDDGVTITGLNTEGGEKTVFEANLAAGSSPNAGALTQTGTFSTAGVDGIASIVVGTKTVYTGGAFVVGQSIVTAQGTLTITGVTPVKDASGDTTSATVAYSYTLNSNTLAHGAAGNDAIFDSFAVTVTDTDGSTASDSLDVKIVDDVPTARADADSVTEDGPLVADGNVITASGGTDANTTDGVLDTRGADGAAVSAVSFGATPGTVGTALAGTYGSLTLKADGSYSYALDNANPLVQGLNGNQTLTEVFAYTLRDGDGDTSPTTLTVTINGANDPVTITGLDVAGGEKTVFEANLSDGSSPNAGALTQSGTFSVAGIDGIVTIKVGGATVFSGGAFVPGQTMNAAFGTLTITSVTPVKDASGDTVSATVAYSYTLNDNTLTHPAAGSDSIFDSFVVTVTDSDGTTATDSLDVKVVDDVPTANPDTNTVNEGATTTGNVLTDGPDDVFGADGRATTIPAGGVVAVNGNAPGTPIVTSLGTLTLLADGSYTYVAKPNTISADTTDSFTYTIRDADGDVSTTTLTISLKAVNGTVADTDVDVDEAGLPVIGSQAAGNGEFDTDGQITVTGATGTFTYTLTSTPPTPYGTLTLNAATGAYSYTLTRPFDNADANDGAVKINAVESYGYRVTDQFGNVIGTGSIAVNVVDDIPTARADTAITVAEDGANVGGNLLANDTQGADGAVVTSVKIGNLTATTVPAAGTVTVTTATGVYTFKADGTWTYNPDPDQSNDTTPVNAGFTYTITDGDGDKSTAAQVISVVDGANPMAGAPITLTVDDQNLANGSTPSATPPVTSAGTIAFVQGSDSIATIVFDTDVSTLTAGNLGWTRVSDTQIVGKDAGSGLTVVTLDLVRSGNSATVTATLSNTYDAHPLSGDDLAALGFVNVVATDSDGDFVKTAVTVQVSDDVPTARDDTATQGAENTAFTIDALFNDTKGADGVNTADATKVSIVTNAIYGVVSYSTATGLFTYTPKAGAGSDGNLSDSFTYRIVDGDGDVSTATVSITLKPDSTPMVKTTTNLSVDEDGFPAHNPDGGTLLHPAEIAGSNSLTDSSGSAVVNFGNDVPATPLTAITLLATAGLNSQIKTLDGNFVTFAVESGVLIGRAAVGGGEVIRVAVTGATVGAGGDVTYTYSTTLSQPLQHTAAGEDTLSLSGVTFRVTDSDTDTTTGSFNVAILDDVPAIDVTKGTETGVVLTTQDAETDGVPTDTDTDVSSAKFGGVFALASNAGSDGTATAPALSYALNVVSGASGLTSHNAAITLYKLASGIVVGSTAGTAPASIDASAVFSVAVASDGRVTLSQYQQVDHAPEASPIPGTGAPFDDQFATLADGLVTLTASATITDRDGDTISDSETIDLGGNIRFADDGPMLSNVAAGAAVSVDETGANFASPVAVSSATAAITATSAFGADGAAANGATSYGLSVVGNGATTLQTAVTNQTITLFQTDASTIVGRYGASLTAFTLKINADGTTTLTQNVALEHGNTLDPNDALTLSGLVNATITIKDFDGDTATASAAIGGNVTFLDDGPSINVTQANEAGVTLRTMDANTFGNASDTAMTANGNFGGVFSLSSSGGADGAAAVPALGYALDVAKATSGLASGGNAITLAKLAGGTVVGYTGGTVPTAETNAQVVFSVKVDAGGTVTLVQYQQIDHPTPGDTAAPYNGTSDDVILGTGLITLTASATITDNDGDTATDFETVDLGGNIRFADDGPTANPDTLAQLTENAPVTINVFGNDLPGADGTLASSATLVAGSLTGLGTLTNNGNGTFTYVQAPGESGSVSFAYTVKDFDGDTSQATATITLVADSTPTVSVSDVTVNEKGLAKGSGEYADHFAPGENLNSDASETATGSFIITTGGDTLTKVEVQAANGTFVNVTAATVGSPISVAGNAGTLTVTSNGAGLYSYSYTLTQNLAHNVQGAGDTKAGDSFAVRVSDSDGDTTAVTAATTIDVTVIDDAPVVFAKDTPIQIANSGNVAGTGNFDFTVGADQRTDFSNGNSDFGTIQLTGTVGTQTITPTNLVRVSESATAASFSFSFSYTASGNTVTETGLLNFDKTNGSYTVDLADPIQASVSPPSVSGSTSIVGYDSGTANVQGSQPAVSVARITPQLFVQFTGFNDSGQPITAPPAPNNTFVNGDTLSGARAFVSVSGSANGVAGDTMGKGEVIDLDFFTTDPKGFDTLVPDARVSTIFVKFDGIGNNEDLIVILKVYDTVTQTFSTRALYVANGDIIKGTAPAAYSGITLDNNDGLIIIEPNDYRIGAGDANLVLVGAQISATDEGITGPAINFNGVTGSTGASVTGQNLSNDTNDTGFKISDIGFLTTTTTLQNASLNFTFQLKDSEGDLSASQVLTANVVNQTTPIALDLDGGGVQFAGLDAGTTFNYGDDGSRVATAWVGKGDGLLAIDLNTNHQVDGGKEIVFSTGTLGDLAGLAATYDTNHDGRLDAADADFAKFGVWQDANGNGVADAGEFHTLSEAGITSIGLVSDGVAYTAANGDVTVAGSATYTRADGSTGTLADASLATAALDKLEAKTAELTATNAAAAGVLAAAAAVAALPVAAAEVAPASVAASDAPAPIALQALPETHEALRPMAETVTSHEAPKAAPSETASHGEDAPAATSSLAVPTDHAALPASADGDQVADAAGAVTSAAPDFGGDAGQLMDALLAAAQTAKAGVGGDGKVANDIAAVQDAFGDSHGAAMVDAVVDHFAGAQAPQPAGNDNALAELFAGHVDAGAGFGPQFDLNQMLSDLSAHAAAQG